VLAGRKLEFPLPIHPVNDSFSLPTPLLSSFVRRRRFMRSSVYHCASSLGGVANFPVCLLSESGIFASARLAPRESPCARRQGEPQFNTGVSVMGKGNNSQKNDKKNKKPKQDAKKPDAKSGGKK
jgi:hypothetical protein